MGLSSEPPPTPLVDTSYTYVSGVATDPTTGTITLPRSTEQPATVVPTRATVKAASTPSQVAHPWQATARTLLATVLAALTAYVAAGPILSNAIGLYLPAIAVHWIIVSLAIAAALSSAITRIMALSSVNALLTRVGLGARPRKE